MRKSLSLLPAAVLAAAAAFAGESPPEALVGFEARFYRMPAEAFLEAFAPGPSTAVKAVWGRGEVNAFTASLAEAKRLNAAEGRGRLGEKVMLTALSQVKYVRDLDLEISNGTVFTSPLESVLQTGFGIEVTAEGGESGGMLPVRMKVNAAGLLDSAWLEILDGKIELPNMGAVVIEAPVLIPVGGLVAMGFTAPHSPGQVFLLTLGVQAEEGEAPAEAAEPPAAPGCFSVTAWLLDHKKAEQSKLRPKTPDGEIDAEKAALARSTGELRAFCFFPALAGAKASFRIAGTQAYLRSFDSETAGGKTVFDPLIGNLQTILEGKIEEEKVTPGLMPLSLRAVLLKQPVKSVIHKESKKPLLSPEFAESRTLCRLLTGETQRNFLHFSEDAAKKYVSTVLVSVKP